MSKIEKMRAKREDLRLQAVGVISRAEAEDRFLTDEENEAVKKFEEEIAKWDESIDRAKTVLAIAKINGESDIDEGMSIVKKMDTKNIVSFFVCSSYSV